MKRSKKIIVVDHALPANAGTNQTAAFVVPESTMGSILVRVYAMEPIAVASGHPVNIRIVDNDNNKIPVAGTEGVTVNNVTIADKALMWECVLPPSAEAKKTIKVQFTAGTSGVESDVVQVQYSLLY